MSRKLLCPPCGVKMRRIAERYPEEGARFVDGTVILQSPGDITITSSAGREVTHVPVCVCDDCNEKLPVGAPATAVTMWAEGRTEPPAWETDYLAPS